MSPTAASRTTTTPGVLADGVAGAYTVMQNWKDSTAKACWNDVHAQYDPQPVRYVIDDPNSTGDKPVDASLPATHGLCTDWL
ncbi:hypothetical protein ABZ172_13470 [Streptomyces sp. NPDC006296]|uniref:hypothetical protein n=1 Tax=Streptomyces sp. NPDC006296 TaxID=3156746 RepID=UPI0033BD3DDC